MNKQVQIADVEAVESYVCLSCGHVLSDVEVGFCMGLCPCCGRDSLSINQMR